MDSYADLELWRPQLVAWAAKRCPDADDVVAETIFRCWLALEQRKTINRAFAFTIASHLLIDGYRKGIWVRRVQIDGLAPRLEDPCAEVGFLDAEANLDAERVLAQAHLTERQCAVLRLTVAGFTLAEIADRLDTTVDAVKKLRWRGQAQVRKVA